MGFRGFLALLSVLLAGCGSQSGSMAELNTRKITLPDGQVIVADYSRPGPDIQRGMMFRDQLPRGRGMLFVHPKPDRYTYWMFQVKVPLDMIWIAPDRRIVEVVANAPPCETKASLCPSYGGHETAQFVLELAGGEAQRLGLKTGQTLTF